jgi:hypothetical protein
MNGWAETLQGPRSLLTGTDIAVTAVEDPGFIILNLPDNQHRTRDALSHALDLAFTGDTGDIAIAPPDGFLIRRTAEEWWMICSRTTLKTVAAALSAFALHDLIAKDMTGHFAALKLAGTAQEEIIGKVVDSFPSRRGCFSEMRIAGACCAALHLRDGGTSYLLVLAPRSQAFSVAETIVNAAAALPRIALFG